MVYYTGFDFYIFIRLIGVKLSHIYLAHTTIFTVEKLNVLLIPVKKITNRPTGPTNFEIATFMTAFCSDNFTSIQRAVCVKQNQRPVPLPDIKDQQIDVNQTSLSHRIDI